MGAASAGVGGDGVETDREPDVTHPSIQGLREAALDGTCPGGAADPCDEHASAVDGTLALVAAYLTEHGVLLSGEGLVAEHFEAIRRTDGEPIYGEFGWVAATDWTAAEEDADGDATAPVEYERVRMHVESVEKRKYPRCSEGTCEEPATHWGLCEVHAREDDPDYFLVPVPQDGEAEPERLPPHDPTCPMAVPQDGEP